MSWVGPAVRAAKDAVLDRTDGLMRLPDGRTFPLARARFGPGHVSLTAPVVLAQDADGGTAHDACNTLVPTPGALVVAERGVRSDAGLFCFVSQRALNAQAAGAVGLVVRPSQSGTGPTAYTGDAGPGLTIPVWGISADDGTAVETYVDEGGELVTVDGDGRRAGENLAGDVLLYTPSVFSDGSSVGHWDSSASPPLLMMPTINPSLPRTMDLTPAAMQDVGWSPATGLAVGATTLGYETPRRARRGSSCRCSTGAPAPPPGWCSTPRWTPRCGWSPPRSTAAAGCPAPSGRSTGALKTVIAVFSFTGGAPRQASVQFRITGERPRAAGLRRGQHRGGHPRLRLQQRRDRTRRWAGADCGGRLDGPPPPLAAD